MAIVVYTTKEAAKILRISVRTLWRRIKEGEIRLTSYGGKRIIRERELERFLDRHTK